MIKAYSRQILWVHTGSNCQKFFQFKLDGHQERPTLMSGWAAAPCSIFFKNLISTIFMSLSLLKFYPLPKLIKTKTHFLALRYYIFPIPSLETLIFNRSTEFKLFSNYVLVMY